MKGLLIIHKSHDRPFFIQLLVQHGKAGEAANALQYAQLRQHHGTWIHLCIENVHVACVMCVRVCVFLNKHDMLFFKIVHVLIVWICLGLRLCPI